MRLRPGNRSAEALAHAAAALRRIANCVLLYVAQLPHFGLYTLT
jgi:hypothetical protein